MISNSDHRWEELRSLFPVTRNFAYLNHAGVAPISTRVHAAIERCCSNALHYGAFQYPVHFDQEIEHSRKLAARLLNASSGEIAFIKNTTEGLGLVANGVDWKEGDEVITCDLEYPSNVYPWWSLQARGVKTIMLRQENHAVPMAQLKEALRRPRVRLLSISSVEFGSGARNDLEQIGALCKQYGVLFCVDAIQSLGCFPLAPHACGIDFLAADGHKWLLSVEGSGIFFCKRESLPALTPLTVGWRSVKNNQNFDHYRMELQDNAGRFEEGTPNTPGIMGLGSAIELLLEIGIEKIAERVLTLTDYLVEGLQTRGAQVLSPRGPGAASGIVAFQVAGETPAATAKRLHQAKVFVVPRRGAVRASPHFYNSQEDIDRLLTQL